jgi:hypothetical protein
MADSDRRSRFRVLVKDDDKYFKYAKVGWLDEGNGLLIYDYQTGEKLSRHSDGHTYLRPAGSGQHLPPSTSVPFSAIERELVLNRPGVAGGSIC